MKFSKIFHPVIHLPPNVEVYDFTQGYDPQRLRDSYGVGKYGEKRKNMYTSSLFQEKEPRDIHLGIDIAAPVGESIYAFDDGIILDFGFNEGDGNYGATLITEHKVEDQQFWVLWGHLSRASISNKVKGQSFRLGDVLAWVGDRYENGGWNSHLHFQLSLHKPSTFDLPGVVSEKDWPLAQLQYPDPRIVLGPLYS